MLTQARAASEALEKRAKFASNRRNKRAKNTAKTLVSRRGMWLECRLHDQNLDKTYMRKKLERAKMADYYAAKAGDPHQQLRVLGQKCPTHRDTVQWQQVQSESALIPWVGDATVSIDRFDVRVLLDCSSSSLCSSFPTEARGKSAGDQDPTVPAEEWPVTQFERYFWLMELARMGLSEAEGLRFTSRTIKDAMDRRRKLEMEMAGIGGGSSAADERRDDAGVENEDSESSSDSGGSDDEEGTDGEVSAEQQEAWNSLALREFSIPWYYHQKKIDTLERKLNLSFKDPVLHSKYQGKLEAAQAALQAAQNAALEDPEQEEIGGDQAASGAFEFITGFADGAISPSAEFPSASSPTKSTFNPQTVASLPLKPLPDSGPTDSPSEETQQPAPINRLAQLQQWRERRARREKDRERGDSNSEAEEKGHSAPSSKHEQGSGGGPFRVAAKRPRVWGT
eukprot:RCo042331